MSETYYVVCVRLLNLETNRHCEFDGHVYLDSKGYWVCPGCKRRNYLPPDAA